VALSFCCSGESHRVNGPLWSESVMGESRLWQIFARLPHGEAEYAEVCCAEGMVAIGWNDVGDLSQYRTREELKSAMLRAWPNYEGRARGLGADAGSLWRFAREVEVGGTVISPDFLGDRYYVGKVKSRYYFQEERDRSDACPFLHRREIDWQLPVSYKEVVSALGSGRIGSQQTAARVRAGRAALLRLIARKRKKGMKPRRVGGGHSIPDSSWGRMAELRAMDWLMNQGMRPRDVASLCVGWEIECGERKYEVKGRRTRATTIRLTENEYAQARKHRRHYMLLVFTAENEKELAKAEPKVIPDPTRTRDWGVRIVREYLLHE